MIPRVAAHSPQAQRLSANSLPPQAGSTRTKRQRPSPGETARTRFEGPQPSAARQPQAEWPYSASCAAEAFFLRVDSAAFTAPMIAGATDTATIPKTMTSKCSCTNGTPPKK